MKFKMIKILFTFFISQFLMVFSLDDSEIIALNALNKFWKTPTLINGTDEKNCSNWLPQQPLSPFGLDCVNNHVAQL